MTEPGHIARVRFLIEAKPQSTKSLYKIVSKMCCGRLVIAKQWVGLRPKHIGLKDEHEVIVLGLAVKMQKRTENHLKECRTCRNAKRKTSMNTRRSPNPSTK